MADDGDTDCFVRFRVGVGIGDFGVSGIAVGW